MIKCEHSWSNRNAVLTGIVLIMMLFLSAETSYASIEERVTLKGFTYSYYSDGQAPEYNQHGEFEGSLGNPVYCGNHGLPSPTGNTVGDSKSFAIYEYDNEIVEKILYYGFVREDLMEMNLTFLKMKRYKKKQTSTKGCRKTALCFS